MSFYLSKNTLFDIKKPILKIGLLNHKMYNLKLSRKHHREP